MVSALVVVLSLLGEHGLSSNMVQPDRIVVADVCNDLGGSPSWVEQHLSLGLGMQCAAAAAHVVVDGYAVNAMLPLDSNDTIPLISSPHPYNNSAQESTVRSSLLHTQHHCILLPAWRPHSAKPLRRRLDQCTPGIEPHSAPHLLQPSTASFHRGTSSLAHIGVAVQRGAGVGAHRLLSSLPLLDALPCLLPLPLVRTVASSRLRIHAHGR